jgi:hypothetical protein
MMDIDLEAEFAAALDRFDQTGCVLPGDLSLYISGLGLQAIEPDGDVYRETRRVYVSRRRP